MASYFVVEIPEETLLQANENKRTPGIGVKPVFLYP